MRSILTKNTEIKKSITKFRATLSKAAEKRKQREWIFPNGEKGRFETFSMKSTEGTLLVGLPEKWGNRVPHLFCLDREGRALSPDVEINIPLGLDRRVSGAYIQDGKDIWLCTRGNFTAFRGRIKREVAFKYFDKWLVDFSDEGRDSSVIPVASISSPTMVDEIAQFVQAVVALKENLKKSGGVDSTSTSEWSDWEEFEGEKSYGGGGAGESYEYIHGPLCNSLHTWLNNWSKNRPFEIRKNKNIDAAIVKQNKAVAIFEVKTSASLSEQLYTAVGQLFYYKQVYGNDNCVLYLVLPGNAVNQGFKGKNVFLKIGIDVIVKHDAKFKTINGTPLSKDLDKIISA